VFMGGCLALFDFQNLLSWRRKYVLKPLVEGTADFTIVIPLFGHPRYFARRDRLEHLRERILVALEVSNEAMQDFALQLEQEGWRVFRTVVDRPSPPRLLLAALEADAVTTAYVMRLDADSVVGHDLPNAVAAARADGADLCSMKVLAHNRRQNACTRFQALEYDMAMLARHYRPWLISGAGVVARTPMLREILRRHSLSPIGEDIEMGRVAFARRMRVRHLDVVIETDVPDSWPALFRQRRLWWAGNFRHSVVNFDRNALQLPGWTLYNLSLVWVGIHFHAWRYPLYLLKPSLTLLYFLLLLVAVSAATTLIANWQVRAPLMAVYPVYAMVQSMLIMSVGALWYLRLLAQTHEPGRYRFGIRRRGLLPELGPRRVAVPRVVLAAPSWRAFLWWG
jgi:cellulose synthase/poly-beta-1,6-N-acetylglucosamine synthase-like glycosyltransferase